MSEKIKENIDHAITPEVQQIKEYNFDEGVQEAIKRIEDLLSRQEYVVVGVNATGTDVGKTRLSGALVKYFHGRNNIAAFGCSSPESFLWSSLKSEISDYQKQEDKGKVVIIFDSYTSFPYAENDKNRILMRQSKDRDVENVVSSHLPILPIHRVDIWIGLCRPDKPFIGDLEEIPLSDIMICNEKAVDK